MWSKVHTQSSSGLPPKMPYMNLLNHAMPKPMAKMTTVRMAIFLAAAQENSKLYFRKEKYVLTPMMNMKKGNTKSVGVNPFHSA